MRPLTPEREKPKTRLFRALSVAQFWGPGPQPTAIVSFFILSLNHRQLGLSLWGGCIVLLSELAAKGTSVHHS